MLLRYIRHYLLLCLVIPLFACAEAEEKFKAGEHYQVLSDRVVMAPAEKVEVMEVFWYGCSHCLHFEPLVNAWKAKQADDVAFARTPAMWDRAGVMRMHATLYYAAESLGILDKVHPDLFAAMAKNSRLMDMDAFADMFAKYGIDRAAFDGALNSFATTAKVAQAQKRAGQNYRVQGTPELIVDGKYRISASMAGGQPQMLEVADFLVEKVRAER